MHRFESTADFLKKNVYEHINLNFVQTTCINLLMEWIRVGWRKPKSKHRQTAAFDAHQ